MATRRLHLTFPEELITQPVIYNIGKEFDLVTNIRRASVEDTVGWVILEVSGSSGDIEAAMTYLEAQGVGIAEPEGDVLEG